MIFIGLCVATWIWYRWFRGEIPYHKTWEEIERDCEIKRKRV